MRFIILGFFDVVNYVSKIDVCGTIDTRLVFHLELDL